MSEPLYLIQGETLDDIADAIRAKTGDADDIDAADFAEEISSIPTGVTPTGTKQISITQNGTTTEDVTNYASAEIVTNVPAGVAGSEFFPIQKNNRDGG